MDTNESKLYTAIILSAVLIFAVFVYFGYTVYIQQLRHFRLLSRNLLAEMDVLEKERTRIANDLHDELGPLLAMTRIQIEQLLPQNDMERQRQEIAIQNLLVLMRRSGEIALNLTPKMLLKKGLKIALEDFVDQYNEISAIHMALDYRLVSRPSAFFALHIFRIVQELIHNAVKHSNAENLKIEIRELKGKLYLFYFDDGIGLDFSQWQQTTEGLGLGSLQNRAFLLGGQMIPTREPENGTEFFFEIPMQLHEE